MRVGADGGDRAGRAASTRTGATSLIEAELVPAGRNRVQVNRQRLARARDLLGVVRVTVFSPDDLTLVKGGPRRSPPVHGRHARRAGGEVRRPAARARPHRAPAQHAAAPGRRSARRSPRRSRSTCGTPGSPTSGDRFGHARATLVDAPPPDRGRGLRAPRRPRHRRRRWTTTRRGGVGGLAPALGRARDADVKRGVSTVGPASRRARPVDRRAAGAHPRLAGRAAHAGAVAAAGRPPPGGRSHRFDARVGARRRAVRARSRSGDGAARPPAAGSGRHHDGLGGAGRGPTRACDPARRTAVAHRRRRPARRRRSSRRSRDAGRCRCRFTAVARRALRSLRGRAGSGRGRLVCSAGGTKPSAR